MKRLLITSYQKSGTHQVYPMFFPGVPQIVDHSNIIYKNMSAWGFKADYPRPEWKETAEALRNMGEKAFGHIPYIPEYVDAVQAQPTKVLFNVRDPRDVIVAEIEFIRGCIRKGNLGSAWLNYQRSHDSLRIHQLKDPLSELIKIAAFKWPEWLGWLDHDFTVLLHYEDLRLNKDKTIQWLRGQLAGCSMPSDDAMKKKSEPTDSTPSFRLGKVGEWKRYFRAHHVELSNRLLGDIFERLGYELGGYEDCD